MARDDAQKPQAAKAKSVKSAPAAKAAQPAAAKTGRRAPEVRPAAAGDTPPSLQRKDIENFVARKSAIAAQDTLISAAQDLIDPQAPGTPAERAKALRALIEGASPDDQRALRKALERHATLSPGKVNPDEELADDWREGGYPYKNLLRRSTYEKQKFRLQVELLKLQAWAKENGQRIVILFEGRDAAGKGGTIKRFMEHLNPRGARVVALEKPTDAERGQWYFQRYVQHLPTHGEIVLFSAKDRKSVV